MRPVQVTGGAGLIGSDACKLPSHRGDVYLTFDSLVTGWVGALKFCPILRGDLLDRDALSAAFAKFQPVAVMHFAALSQVVEASREPARQWRNNVLGSLNFVRAMVASGFRHIVYYSNCATYGSQDGVVLGERSAQVPHNSYGGSKRAVEDILRDFGGSHRLKGVVFR